MNYSEFLTLMWGILLFKSPFYSMYITLLQKTGMENGAREKLL